MGRSRDTRPSGKIRLSGPTIAERQVTGIRVEIRTQKYNSRMPKKDDASISPPPSGRNMYITRIGPAPRFVANVMELPNRPISVTIHFMVLGGNSS